MSVITNIKAEDITTIGTIMAPVFALLTLCVTTFGAVALAWIGYKQSIMAGMLKENTDITKKTHENTNSKIDKLIEESSEVNGRLASIKETRKDPNR